MFPALCRRFTRVLSGGRCKEVRIIRERIGGRRRLYLAHPLGSHGENPAIRNAEEHGNGPSTSGACFSEVSSEDSRDPLDIHLSKADLLGVIYKFRRRSSVRAEATEQGLEGITLLKAMDSFCHVLSNPSHVKKSPELLVTISDILAGTGHVDDLFPYFLAYARWRYPEEASMTSLKEISDLTSPPAWYPSARAMKRRLVYHAGPTNSGKTYHALNHFLSAEYAIYCGPIKMLVHEIFHKSNKQGVPCDLLTGDYRQFASGSEELPATHLSCTVEMAKVNPDYFVYDVAVIDEMQMLKDEDRGGAWTRAILGLSAREIHMCGHECAISIVKKLAKSMGEEVEVVRYDRLVPLQLQSHSLKGRYQAVQPGDCLVVFSRRKIFELRDYIERTTNHRCAVIYGGLPSATRIQQANLFNDPQSKCNILVATDAVGMGLNLNIHRIVFHTLRKQYSTINSSLAKQIAGRAGRFGMQHSTGQVTTFHEEDLGLMHKLLSIPEKPIKQAGISPATEQIEMFSNYLPGANLWEILDLFLKMAKVDGNYFLCVKEASQDLAHLLQDIPMPIRDLFTFVLSPVDPRKTHDVKALYHFASVFSRSETVTFPQLCAFINWPLPTPHTPVQLTPLENAYDILELYLWLGMRFPDVFVASEEARKLQHTIEGIIGKSIDRRFPKYQRWRGEIIKRERELGLFDEEQESFLKRLQEVDEREGVETGF